MTDPGGAPGGESEPRRRGSYLRRLHVEFIVLLAIICVVFAYLGWSWRPQSSGFPAIPQGLTFQVDAENVVAREVLTRTEGDGAVLEVFLEAETRVGAEEHWSASSSVVTIYDLGKGRVCTPGEYSDVSTSAAIIMKIPPWEAIRHPARRTTLESAPSRTVVRSSGLGSYLRLCWKSDAPVQLNGSYLGARFPPVAGWAPLTIGPPAADVNASVLRTLHPGAETRDFAIHSQPRPTNAGPESWEWARDSSSAPIQLSAVDVSDTQHADYLTFLSGIAFGLAGAAIIALLGEFILPLHQRREDRG